MMSTATNERKFQMYQQLKGLRGKPIEKIKHVLDTKGFEITEQQVRFCCSTGADLGLMKKTKVGFRLEKTMCDAHIKSFFRECIRELENKRTNSGNQRSTLLENSNEQPGPSSQPRFKLSNQFRIGGIALLKDVRSREDEVCSDLKGIGRRSSEDDEYFSYTWTPDDLFTNFWLESARTP